MRLNLKAVVCGVVRVTLGCSGMVIDAHTHLDEEDIYQSYMKKSFKKVDLAFVLHWYKDDLEQVYNFISSKADLKLIASVDINTPERIAEQLTILAKYLEQNKIIGVKIYPGYQHFYVSDERIFSVAELCVKYSKPLVIHCGDVYDITNQAVLKYTHPIYVDDLAVKFPNLKVVIAHFGFPHLLECANVVSKNTNVYTDISGTIIDELPQKEAMGLFNEYKKDIKRALNYFPDIRNKIMFGTDYGGEDTPKNEIDLNFKLVNQIFSKKERKTVFYRLAQKLFLE